MIQSNGKYRPEKIPYLDTFQAVEMLLKPKAKGRTSNRVLQENKARNIFRKANISCPMNTTRLKYS